MPRAACGLQIARIAVWLLRGPNNAALLRPGLCVLLLESVLTNLSEDESSEARDWDSFEADFKAKAKQFESAYGHVEVQSYAAFGVMPSGETRVNIVNLLFILYL